MDMSQAVDYLNQQRLKRYPALEGWLVAVAMNDVQRHNMVDAYTAFLNNTLLYQKQKWYLDWKKREQRG